MQFRIKSEVKANFNFVASNFGKPLFIYLLPIFPPIRLVTFEGTELGNRVVLEMKIGSHVMNWVSQIIDTRTYETEYNFIDQGVKLPIFLIYWEHKHRVIRHLSGAVIIDEIYYKSPNMIIELLFYPILFFTFYLRRFAYRSFFKQILLENIQS